MTQYRQRRNVPQSRSVDIHTLRSQYADASRSWNKRDYNRAADAYLRDDADLGAFYGAAAPARVPRLTPTPSRTPQLCVQPSSDREDSDGDNDAVVPRMRLAVPPGGGRGSTHSCDAAAMVHLANGGMLNRNGSLHHFVQDAHGYRDAASSFELQYQRESFDF